MRFKRVKAELVILLRLLLPLLCSSSSRVDGPVTSVAKPWQEITNHIHANVNFDARKSSTFTLVDKKHAWDQASTMMASYADRSYLKFLSAQDLVRLGPYRVESRFGVIEHSESLEFRRCDGILGMGYSDLKRSACFFRTMTSLARPSWKIFQPPSAVTLQRRQFSFVANEFLGELQLGGYDAGSISDAPFYTKMLNETGYGVEVSSIVYNGVQILDWSERYRGAALLSILDTGSSCIMLPNSTYNGTYRKSPFMAFEHESSANPGLDLDITFGICNRLCDTAWNAHLVNATSRCCKNFTIPAKRWMYPGGCVQPFNDMNVLILGDPIFRSMLVLHDLEPPVYRVGLAPIHPDYSIGSAPINPWRAKADSRRDQPPLTKHVANRTRYWSNRTSSLAPMAGGARHTARSGREGAGGQQGGESSKAVKVAVEGMLETRYVISLGIGEPAQTVRVLLDTGSMLLAVFADPFVQEYVHEKDRISQAFAELKTTERKRWKWLVCGMLLGSAATLVFPMVYRRCKVLVAGEGALGAGRSRSKAASNGGSCCEEGGYESIASCDQQGAQDGVREGVTWQGAGRWA